MLSVIVPIYNIENYLPKCIKSITEQTYQELELLLIDDGSTDSCPRICDEAAQRDGRIKVIHKENGGLVSARKVGLCMAEGDYITFVDGDDWIDREMYQELMKALKDSKGDFIDSGYICDGEKKEDTVKTAEKKEYKLDEYIRHRFFLSLLGMDDFITMSPSIWSKIFRADFIKDCYAKVPDSMSYGEDVINLLHCILKADKMMQVKKAFYHYTYREESMSHLKSVSYIRKEAVLWNYCRTVILENDGLMEQEHMDLFLFGKLYAAFEFIASSEFDTVQYYAFPHIEKLFGKKIVLYGAGRVGKDYLTQISKYERCEIVCWTDRQYEKFNYKYRKVISIEEALRKTYDILLIGVEKEESAEEIRSSLQKRNVLNEKIVWCKPNIIGS